MMRKRLLTAVLVFCTYLFASGQPVNKLTDSLFRPDSIPAGLKSTTRITAYVAPAAFIGYGVVSLMGDNAVRRLDYTTNAELREDYPSFAFKLDNYLRYAPAVAVYGLDLVGIKAKNSIFDRSMMLLSSYAIVAATTGTAKVLTNRLRPNGTNYHSFPSGHASLAFMTAEFLHQEYKDHSIWYSIGGYAIATGTGVLRLYNNAHWVSDVVAGAGVGILSTKLTYLVYPYIKRKLFHGKAAHISISPGYQNGSMNFNLIKRL